MDDTANAINAFVNAHYLLPAGLLLDALVDAFPYTDCSILEAAIRKATQRALCEAEALRVTIPHR